MLLVALFFRFSMPDVLFALWIFVFFSSLCVYVIYGHFLCKPKQRIHKNHQYTSSPNSDVTSKSKQERIDSKKMKKEKKNEDNDNQR